MRRSTILLWVALAVAGSAGASDDACLAECGADPGCEAEVTDCLLEAGRVRDAIGRLKRLLREHPGVPAFPRLLARAYLAENNTFWAIRTLREAVDRNPGDCESRSWLAWVHFDQGHLDLAREVLQQPGCPVTEAERSRWLLLRAHMARLAGDHAEAAVIVRSVLEAEQIYPEDEGLLLYLRRREAPAWIKPLYVRLDLSGGYTSNAAAGSVTDPSETGPASALGRLDLFGRLVLPAWPSVRPVLEGFARGHGLASGEASGLSYMELFARPGVMFVLGAEYPRLLVTYDLEALFLDQKEGGPFYMGHRAEVELEFDGLTAFAGAGRRFFDEDARTRTEIDGGLGGSLGLHRRLRVLLACTLEYHLAVDDMYDQLGANGLVSLLVDLGAGFQARVGGTAGIDYYPHSEGDYGIDENRFEILARLSTGLWSPSWLGARLGLTYDFSWRDSNLDNASMDYDYQEHRLLVWTRWTFDLDPWAPEVVRPEGHVALDYGIGERADAGLDEERIQDLLRQEELDRRGTCGCGN